MGNNEMWKLENKVILIAQWTISIVIKTGMAEVKQTDIKVVIRNIEF